MQKGHLLQFNCQGCQNPIEFSVFELDKNQSLLKCSHCNRKYSFDDAGLKRQLKKFEDLCLQLIESEEILSDTSVGIDVGEHSIKIPFKLLLTRLNSHLDLIIGDKPLSISFRLEPLKDLPDILLQKETPS
jgi:hypothetical protein